MEYSRLRAVRGGGGGGGGTPSNGDSPAAQGYAMSPGSGTGSLQRELGEAGARSQDGGSLFDSSRSDGGASKEKERGQKKKLFRGLLRHRPPSDAPSGEGGEEGAASPDAGARALAGLRRRKAASTMQTVRDKLLPKKSRKLREQKELLEQERLAAGARGGLADDLDDAHTNDSATVNSDYLDEDDSQFAESRSRPASGVHAASSPYATPQSTREGHGQRAAAALSGQQGQPVFVLGPVPGALHGSSRAGTPASVGAGAASSPSSRLGDRGVGAGSSFGASSGSSAALPQAPVPAPTAAPAAAGANGFALTSHEGPSGDPRQHRRRTSMDEMRSRELFRAAAGGEGAPGSGAGPEPSSAVGPGMGLTSTPPTRRERQLLGASPPPPSGLKGLAIETHYSELTEKLKAWGVPQERWPKPKPRDQGTSAYDRVNAGATPQENYKWIQEIKRAFEEDEKRTEEMTRAIKDLKVSTRQKLEGMKLQIEQLEQNYKQLEVDFARKETHIKDKITVFTSTLNTETRNAVNHALGPKMEDVYTQITQLTGRLRELASETRQSESMIEGASQKGLALVLSGAGTIADAIAKGLALLRAGLGVVLYPWAVLFGTTKPANKRASASATAR